MTDELKPCPFCDGHPSLFPNDDDNGWWIGCDDCDAEINRSEADKAVAAWNTRTPTPAAPQEGAPETIGVVWFNDGTADVDTRSPERPPNTTYTRKDLSDARIASLEVKIARLKGEA